MSKKVLLNKIRRLHKEGKSLRAIGREVNLQAGSVKYFLDRYPNKKFDNMIRLRAVNRKLQNAIENFIIEVSTILDNS
jgi:hypothetical protein